MTAAARACAVLERRLVLPAGTLRLELMIETPQSIVSADGISPLRGFVTAGDGRVTGVHFGAYDYTALCGITAAWQDVRHPACDFARRMIQASLAQTGVHLSDSVTTLLPVPIHRLAGDRPLTAEQQRENEASGPPRLEAPLRQRPSFAHRRLLSELGSAPGAVAGPLRRGLRLLPVGTLAPRPRGSGTSSNRPPAPR